jgi:hypothetical protein
MGHERPALKNMEGQPSYRVANGDVEVFVTRTGGHMGPVTFDRKGRKIRPYSVAPWAKEKLPPGTPPIIRVLRGDFFCLPFGGNDTPYRGEQHPIHGETANANWAFESVKKEKERQTLHLSLRTRVRKGRVDKRIRLVKGHNALYVQHLVSGMSGMMNFGHHAMLKFPDKEGSGLISTSPFVFGQTFPGSFESPEDKGYCSLRPNAKFSTLSKVPMADGKTADLSRFPLRKGYEDLVMMVADDRLPFAWSTVTFPGEGYAWFALKDPGVLRGTVFWISNGGRHYAPWNGRHTSVVGIEDVTSNFHFGLAESARKNPVSAKGHATVLRLQAQQTLAVNYIMGVVKVPRGFKRVKHIKSDKGGHIVLVDEQGKSVRTRVEHDFLKEE